ncbi:Ferredoxin domain containing protein [Natrarchaeobaculum sulfurireducens]|uniref:Ferredoxin domain containing protein n=1 Tax=Natrarchaeobaculum sulfurireducens TaxID=2044521 RepID=A0A346PDB2_9EURY|nr:Ferredoxin domain containing protein [Natrarchaeobaculum sulfurireducens]
MYHGHYHQNAPGTLPVERNSATSRGTTARNTHSRCWRTHSSGGAESRPTVGDASPERTI